MWHRPWKLPGWLWQSLGYTAILLVALAAALCPAAQEEGSAAGAKQSFVQTGQLQAGNDYFAGGTDWLNTAKPLSAADLRGRVVLLDFWTLC